MSDCEYCDHSWRALEMDDAVDLRGGEAEIVDLYGCPGRGVRPSASREAVLCKRCGALMEQPSRLQSAMAWDRRACGKETLDGA